MGGCVDEVAPYQPVRGQQRGLVVLVGIRQAVVAQVKHGFPVALALVPRHGLQKGLLAAEAKLRHGAEDGAGEQLVKAGCSAVGFDNIVEQHNLLLRPDAPRRESWGLVGCGRFPGLGSISVPRSRPTRGQRNLPLR